MEYASPLHLLSDEELLRRLAEVLGQSRRVEADLVAHIGEVDSRRLFAREASPSMYAYCTEVLHLSEAEAYLRITVARAARSFPQLLDMLRDGRLHLTGIVRLVPHLTLANTGGLLKQATHKSKRQILELVAQIAPRADVPAVMRRLPARHEPPASMPTHGSVRAGSGSTSSLGSTAAVDSVARTVGPDRPASCDQVPVDDLWKLSPAGVGNPSAGAGSSACSSAVVEPLAPARYRVQFTATAQLHDKLQRLQAMLRPRIPDGDLAKVIEEAVSEKLARLEAKRFARAQAPRKRLLETDCLASARYIPAAVRRAVALRDDKRCRYVDEKGRRCPARDGLEFHHRHPFGLGGDHSPRNIMLVCRQHNRYLAEHDFGRRAMRRFEGQRREPVEELSGNP